MTWDSGPPTHLLANQMENATINNHPQPPSASSKRQESLKAPHVNLLFHVSVKEGKGPGRHDQVALSQRPPDRHRHRHGCCVRGRPWMLEA